MHEPKREDAAALIAAELAHYERAVADMGRFAERGMFWLASIEAGIAARKLASASGMADAAAYLLDLDAIDVCSDAREMLREGDLDANDR